MESQLKTSLWLIVFSALAISAPPVAAETIYIHVDHLGSPIMETDQHGNVVWEADYGPYGELILLGGTETAGPGYTGHYHDQATGLIYMQQRYYDPAAARFMSVDPVTPSLEDGSNFNRYWYANNNPYLYVDPDGRFGIIGFVIGAAVDVGVQMAVDGKSLGEVDAKSALIAGAVGSITGGIGGTLANNAARGAITTANAITRTGTVGATASGGGSVVESIANGESTDAGKVAVAAAAGGIGGTVGARIGNAGTAQLERAARAGGIPAHVSHVTQSANVGSSAEAFVSAGQKGAQVAVDVATAAGQRRAEWELER